MLAHTSALYYLDRFAFQRRCIRSILDILLGLFSGVDCVFF